MKLEEVEQAFIEKWKEKVVLESVHSQFGYYTITNIEKYYLCSMFLAIYVCFRST